jgi:hypothetical protein
MDTYNSMTYQEAVDRINLLSSVQRQDKKVVKKFNCTFKPIYYEAINSRRNDINLLLSLIHAHKTAMKLHAEVKRLMKENERLQSINIRLAHQVKVD